MELLINLIDKYGESILIFFVLFWVACAIVVALCVPSWMKHAPLMPDDFDVEENILKKRK